MCLRVCEYERALAAVLNKLAFHHCSTCPLRTVQQTYHCQ